MQTAFIINHVWPRAHTQKDAQTQTRTHTRTLHARAHAFENTEVKQTERT